MLKLQILIIALLSSVSTCYAFTSAPTPLQQPPYYYQEWIADITPIASLKPTEFYRAWGVDLLTNNLPGEPFHDVKFYLENYSGQIPYSDSTQKPKSISVFTTMKNDISSMFHYFYEYFSLSSFLAGAFVLILGMVIGIKYSRMQMRHYRRW